MELKIDEKGSLELVKNLDENETVIIVPDGVVCICKDAFREYRNHVKRIILPESVTAICDNAFSNLYSLEEINLPSALKEIGVEAFSGCKNLKNIEIPDSVVKIGFDTFYLCEGLERVVLPENVSSIPAGAFQSCKNLKEINLPARIDTIEELAFCECCNLEKIVLPSALKRIGNGAFRECSSLKEINIPNNVNYIGYNAFKHCQELTKIDIKGKVKIISDGAFHGCLKLEDVTLSDDTLSIGDEAFFGCENLKKIYLGESLVSIGEGAFVDCKSLNEIDIPSTIKNIQFSAFSGCEKLEKIEMGQNLEYIGGNAFYACIGLKEVYLPGGLQIIESQAFGNCINLEKINLPDSIKTLGAKTFQNCESLKKIKMPNKIKEITGTFRGCKSIEQIILPSNLKIVGENTFNNCFNLKEIEFPASLEGLYYCMHGNNLEKITLCNYTNLYSIGLQIIINDFKYYYLDKETKKLIIANIEQKDGKYQKIDCEDKIDEYQDELTPIILSIMFEKEELESKNIKVLGNSILENITCENITIHNYREIAEKLLNSKEFYKLIHRICEEFSSETYDEFVKHSVPYYDIFKLAYTLGAFNEEQADRQKACEFIFEGFKKKYFNLESFHSSFESLDFNGYNEEWSSLFRDKNNIKELMEKEKSERGISARIYNNFNRIKEFNRSNRGGQNYRKVTVYSCFKFFSMANFENVNEENIDISETIFKYTNNQDSFDDACEIRKTYLMKEEEGKIKSHILGEPLIEEVISDIEEILGNLNDIANDKFTYEFLSKKDPQNFVLGKYCSCCAHLEGVGYGVMKASILHPDCQNLVIRDKDGNIIAKSTLYINKKQRYGVFNNVEVKEGYNDEQLKAIYEKYIEAINAFVRIYNKKNKDNQLDKITVGMGLNDLKDLIEKNNGEAKDILNGISFSDFGKSGKSYNGDWQGKQYVVWSNEEKKIRN